MNAGSEVFQLSGLPKQAVIMIQDELGKEQCSSATGITPEVHSAVVNAWQSRLSCEVLAHIGGPASTACARGFGIVQGNQGEHGT